MVIHRGTSESFPSRRGQAGGTSDSARGNRPRCVSESGRGGIGQNLLKRGVVGGLLKQRESTDSAVST